MTTEYYETEARIKRAVAYQSGLSEPLPVTILANTFDAPYQRLRRRLQGYESRSTRSPTNMRLSSDQEEELLTELHRCERLGDHVGVRAITISANSILRRSHEGTEPAPTVTMNWASRFLKRHPTVVNRGRVPQKTARAAADGLEDLASAPPAADDLEDLASAPPAAGDLEDLAELASAPPPAAGGMAGTSTYSTTCNDQDNSFISPPPMVSDMGIPPANPSSIPGPRNLPRASHACERCRAKKAKCDQCQPCSRCVRHAAQCYYGVSKRSLRTRQPRQVQRTEVTSASAEVASPVPSIDRLPEELPQEINNGDEIGDVNERTHGMEFYGTSSNHVLLNQLFSFVRNNRRHGQLHASTVHPVVPSNDQTEVDDSFANRLQAHQSCERPSAVNLLSIEEPLFPPSRRDTPPPTLQSRGASGARAISTGESQFANTPSSRFAPSNFAGSSHLRSPGRIGGNGSPLIAAKHRLERDLVRSYLRNLHYLHPMLDGPEFMLQCEAELWSLDANAGKSAQRRHFKALFSIVVAVGALVAGREIADEFSQEIVAIEQSKRQPATSPQQVSLRTLSRSYFQEARAFLGDVFEVCSLESAQTLLLMVSSAYTCLKKLPNT